MPNNLHLGSDVSVRVESSHDSRGVVGNTERVLSAIVGRDGEVNSNGPVAII